MTSDNGSHESEMEAKQRSLYHEAAGLLQADINKKVAEGKGDFGLIVLAPEGTYALTKMAAAHPYVTFGAGVATGVGLGTLVARGVLGDTAQEMMLGQSVRKK